MYTIKTICLSLIENSQLSTLFEGLNTPIEINTKDWKFVAFSQGEKLLDDAALTNRFILVGDGRTRLQLLGPKSRQLCLYRIEGGDICLHSYLKLGLNELFAIEMIAETDGWMLWSDKQVFQQLLEDSPTFSNWALANLSHRFSELMLKVQQLAFSPIRVRIAEYLLEKLDHDSQIKATQSQLAIDLGTAREVINRQLKQMQNKQIISIKRGVIRVLDIPRLLDQTEI